MSMGFAVATVLLFGGLAGWLRWSAHAGYRRPMHFDPEDSLSVRRPSRTWRRIRRVLIAVCYAIIGGCLGLLALSLIRR